VNRLHVQVRQGQPYTQLFLEGFIDENASFENVIASLAFPLEIDLGGVYRINSVGVRTWIEFINSACSRGEVILVRCPEVLIHQFSMVTSTLGTAIVRSVLAPYVCQKCGLSEPQEVTLPADRVVLPNEQFPPARQCTSCRGDSRFDDVTDTFFFFLMNR
jgi:hypothetical protein